VNTVIVSGDAPDSSDYCSKPYVNAFAQANALRVFDSDFKTMKSFRIGRKKLIVGYTALLPICILLH
jgi:hypothetical protein